MNGTLSSKTQIIFMVVSAVIVLMGFSYMVGASSNVRQYVHYGAEQHWKGEIVCGRIGNKVFCAETGDEQ